VFVPHAFNLRPQMTRNNSSFVTAFRMPVTSNGASVMPVPRSMMAGSLHTGRTFAQNNAREDTLDGANEQESLMDTLWTKLYTLHPQKICH
jgi:hypothetical protein